MRFLYFLFLCSSCFANAVFSEKLLEPWGSDSDLIQEFERPTFNPKSLGNSSSAPHYSIPSKVGQSMIRFFQRYISPIDGPRSSYYPSSSQYALLAIQRYGLLTGIALGCDRLMRENGELWIYKTTFYYDRPLKLDLLR